MGLPSGLKASVFAGGFEYPTDFAFLPDGSLLVAAKNGLVSIVSARDRKPAVFLDLRAKVSSASFRGVTDVTVDPDFSAHPYIYVTYAAIGTTAKSIAPTVVRVSRFTVTDGVADPTSEHVIVGAEGTSSCLALPRTADCLPSEVAHDGSDIAFAHDGTMFLSTGDGGGGEVVQPVAFLAQNLDTLGGKVLHIDRNGKGLPSNPDWNGDPRSNRSRIWASGLRNPFRLTLLAGHGAEPLVADVGWDTWERLVFASRGANLGWPCYEGPQRTPKYSATPFCTAFYRAHPTAPTAPWIALHHDRAQSITGGVSLAKATDLPQRFRRDYVFGDWINNTISVLPLPTTSKPPQPTIIARNTAGPTAFKVGPDGALYYLAANLGQVRRIVGRNAVTNVP